MSRLTFNLLVLLVLLVAISIRCSSLATSHIETIQKQAPANLLDLKSTIVEAIGPDYARMQTYGSPCTGRNGQIPLIVRGTLPSIGKRCYCFFYQDYIRPSPNEIKDVWIFVSTQRSTFNNVTLPIQLPGLTDVKGGNCRIYIGNGFTYYFSPTTTSNGPFTRNGDGIYFLVDIPNNPALAGNTFYFQMLVSSPGANPANMLTSNALSLTIGKAP